MDPRHLFMDERLTGRCVYCGARPDTRDHVPSKVLLDKPYPAQLPVVEACKSCNLSFSLDEEYLACLIECVISGTVDASGLRRLNIQRILDEKPALKHEIRGALRKSEVGNLLWVPEIDRVRNVILKLARGHVAYELYAKLEEPSETSFAPIRTMSDHGRTTFEKNLTAGSLDVCPEIGSRAFLRAFVLMPGTYENIDDWIMLQPGRYRYSVVEGEGVSVRIVLSEYLACYVSWD